MNKKLIAVTSVGWEIPGWNNESVLDALDDSVVYGEFKPQDVLGKKGLRYKDEATKLALCAVHKALDRAGILELEKEQRKDIGIIVSSNLGNMDTVCQESEIIHQEHVDKTSPMNLPVASSNVIPSSIAIRYGFKAVNLMLCNGATSGVDAINMAIQMIRSGRAEKMVVVGVEPCNEITEQMMTECNPDNPNCSPANLGELASCLILEAYDENSSAKVYGLLGDYEYFSEPKLFSSNYVEPDVWFVPAQTSSRSKNFINSVKKEQFNNSALVDASKNTGELYGALGVYQVLQALFYLKRENKQTALVSNGLTYGDGLSSIEVKVQ
ncbi:beta-ketoacyl synthase N-terminal-like domain-containing protein [Aliikangiella sp. IMCC44359]|uniref:beta-ketoacyl synthase N-terminal-like domain-containing protein n=1 Tax=Aliikangiella sp. IMCC44359 TaxID=3459125 RepID=UPI00403B0627